MLIAKYLNPNSDIEEMIKHFEEEYKISLPIQYKTFLKKYNGGYTPKTSFQIKRFMRNITGFYGIGDVKRKIENIVDLSDFLKKNWLPIAYNGWGDYIAIGLNGEDEGKIYYFDYQRGYRKKFLADDLKHFFDYCKSGEIDPDVYLSVEERKADLLANGMGEYITDGLKEAWQDEIDKYKDMVREEVIID